MSSVFCSEQSDLKPLLPDTRRLEPDTREVFELAKSCLKELDRSQIMSQLNDQLDKSAYVVLDCLRLHKELLWK